MLIIFTDYCRQSAVNRVTSKRNSKGMNVLSLILKISNVILILPKFVYTSKVDKGRIDLRIRLVFYFNNCRRILEVKVQLTNG